MGTSLAERPRSPRAPLGSSLEAYAETFQGAEPYLLDLYAAICHDAGDMPSVEGARQFWEHVRAQNPSPLPPPVTRPPSAGRGGSRPTSATWRASEKPWAAEDRLCFRNLRMGAAAASCLAMQLKGKNLTTLDLGENQLGDNAAAALASLIHALPKLQSFTLAGNMIGPAGIKELATSELEVNETLEHLALGEPSPAYSTVVSLARPRPNYVTTEGLHSLLTGLARNAHRRLSALNLCRTALKADAGQVLADFLESDSVLTDLDVSCNALTSEGISTLLPACIKLQKLDISDTSCRGELIHAKLCDLLQKASGLSSLGVAFNSMEPRPLRRIARQIAAAPALQALNMACTAMETDGVVALADGLLNSQVSNLRELDLSENGICELEAAAYLARIVTGTELQTLRLNRNPLGDEGACELADALQDERCLGGPALRVLELGSCRVGKMGATALAFALRENERLLSLRLSDNFLDDTLDITLIEALQTIQQLQLESNRLSHRSLARVAEVCARNRRRVRDKEPRALRQEIRRLKHEEVTLKEHKLQAAKDSAEVFVRLSAQNIAAEELRQLRLGIMKSARQTEQKVAAVEATLLERRKYLESVKEALTVTAKQNELAIAAKREALGDKENQLSDLQGRLRDLEAQLARRRAQHPKQVAEIREEISAALPKTEELKAKEEDLRRELKALQEKSLIGFKP
ncbi:unnamed protein product [Effrenium voratum]|uniref:Uncharacterized protein n=1 Tax=Effrenium voratum TaxID=2562239 RepID=A0AA36IIT5_9DINO|nr:unnamed protein product [Effrenium voratum]